MTADTAGIIERLRNATGADRELDRDIAEAVGYEWPGMSPSALRLMAEGERRGMIVAPFYTASIDHALSLVPEDMGFSICTHIRGLPPGAMVSVDEGDPERDVQANGATPAIALCIAALLARQAREGAGDA
jgi:hypothetical protein